ncbi:GNAT family N-acetyltransferase [Alphaproteobacteria bacterium]|nr:GNAT family N-acetyltransferase [Alphaproteobacteria bacterium]
MKLVFNPFETKLLGYKAGVINLPNSRLEPEQLDALRKILVEAVEINYQFLSMRCSPPDLNILGHLLHLKFVQIERLVAFEKRLDKFSGLSVEGVREAKIEDVSAMKTIASSAFKFDRFHADKSISNDVADNLKVAWVENAFRYRSDRVFVHETCERINGFISTLLDENSVSIDLIAVSRDAQRKRIGTSLVAFVEEFYQKKCSTIKVGTQDKNNSSMAMYQQLGFEPSMVNVTFHWRP